MNIGLYYYNPFETGGCEKTMLERGKILSSLGHEITYIFGSKHPQMNTIKLWSEVGNVIHQDYLEKDFDMIIYDSIYNNKIIPANNIIQIMNGNVIDGKEVYNGNADRYVCVSEECQRQFKEKYGYDSIVIPNAINVKRIKELAKEKYDIPKKKYNFVVVSRIDEAKGFDNLEKLISKIDSKTKDYQFVIVGSNNNFPRYVERLKQRFKKYNVIWEGLQNNPYKYMANADYLVQLSKFESQCMAMYESMIIGTPVIVTDFDNAKKDVTEERGFVLRQDLSNLDIDTILSKKGSFKFKYDYPDVTEMWKKAITFPPKKDLKFSIIIPNYNNEEWLRKCLDSVASQTYKNYELIFIDDMSTDNSVKIAYEYADKIKHMFIFQNESKRYNGGTRNVGILEACGDYIICLDSDDWFIDNKVLEKLNKFIKNEDIIRTGYSLSDGKRHNLIVDIPKHNSLQDIFEEPTCAIWTKVIKTSILKDTLFSEGTLMEDKVHHYRIVEKCKTWRDYPEVTHVWNRANKKSTSTDRNYKWNNCMYRHIADMLDFIAETKNDKYKKFVQRKIMEAKILAEKGDFRQI